ncbi:FAR-17a/AIG1-like protein [Nocardioides dokdonensis FR1436]|uniref:FAR-17a/AIG1-like protein n=1 Tax=Nocardioides dokdonensis FR1436 TaxID=1300347 RepID=A0A1A9GMN3_9ACTN|nr:Pr6Pr family membrane protein [Nocardioides dokdonensis]ANH38863.1 FAR-17a/AIG1-like protein [Nocardioides dokdonensis FR1436]
MSTKVRSWYALVALVACSALLLQLVLVVQGGRVLDEQTVPPLGIRLGRLVSYFTIQSNLLVAVTAVHLARAARRGPGHGSTAWTVARLDAVVGITITGLVHFVLLRPLLDLSGADALADALLHLVVPVLALGGFLLVGPRPPLTRRTAGLALVWPLAWLGWTLVVGLVSGWFPYPFLDHREDGWAAVVVTCVAITALFVALLGACALASRLGDRAREPRPLSPTSG